MVELAFSLSILLMVTLGGVEFGKILYTKHILDKATYEAARAASLQADPADVSSTALAVFSDVLTRSGFDLGDPTPTLDASVINLSGFEAVSVTANYDYESVYTQTQEEDSNKIFSLPPISLSSTSVMRKEG